MINVRMSIQNLRGKLVWLVLYVFIPLFMQHRMAKHLALSHLTSKWLYYDLLQSITCDNVDSYSYKRDLRIEKHLPRWNMKFIKCLSWPPFPSKQLKYITLFLIQGSQQIMIKYMDVQLIWWYPYCFSITEFLSFIHTFGNSASR